MHLHISLLDFISIGLASWRVSHMLVHEEGPFRVFVKLRSLFGIIHDDDGTPIAWPDNCLLGCVWCLSVWVAVVFILLPGISYIFAASAIACFIERLIWQEPKHIQASH